MLSRRKKNVNYVCSNLNESEIVEVISKVILEIIGIEHFIVYEESH